MRKFKPLIFMEMFKLVRDMFNALINVKNSLFIDLVFKKITFSKIKSENNLNAIWRK